MPAPSYVIKEMTNVFVARSELLPDGETLEQHAQWQKEEADIVRNDRNDGDTRTGGLFRGCFDDRQVLGAFYDREDDVERCPSCGWEVDDGICAGCGYNTNNNAFSEDEIDDDISDDDDEEDDEDDELDRDDFDGDDDDGLGPIAAANANLFQGGGIPASERYDLQARYNRMVRGESYASSEEDDDDYTSLNGFIDDQSDAESLGGQIASGDSSDAHTASSTNSTPQIRRRRIVIDSDDEDPVPASRRTMHTVLSDDEDDSDSDSVPEVVASRYTLSTRRPERTITIVDSDDDSLNSESELPESDVYEEVHAGELEIPAGQRQDIDNDIDNDSEMADEYGFSPLQPSDDDNDNDDNIGIADDDDEQDSVEQLSDDDDEEDEDENENHQWR